MPSNTTVFLAILLSICSLVEILDAQATTGATTPTISPKAFTDSEQESVVAFANSLRSFELQVPATGMYELTWNNDLALSLEPSLSVACSVGTPATTTGLISHRDTNDGISTIPSFLARVFQTWGSSGEGSATVRQISSGLLFGRGFGTNVYNNYSALVWAASSEIGCAFVECSSSTRIIQCTFNSIGNVPNEPWYYYGPPASDCPAGSLPTVAGLCAVVTDAELDTIELPEVITEEGVILPGAVQIAGLATGSTLELYEGAGSESAGVGFLIQNLLILIFGGSLLLLGIAYIIGEKDFGTVKQKSVEEDEDSEFSASRKERGMLSRITTTMMAADDEDSEERISEASDERKSSVIGAEANPYVSIMKMSDTMSLENKYELGSVYSIEDVKVKKSSPKPVVPTPPTEREWKKNQRRRMRKQKSLREAETKAGNRVKKQAEARNLRRANTLATPERKKKKSSRRAKVSRARSKEIPKKESFTSSKFSILSDVSDLSAYDGRSFLR